MKISLLAVAFAVCTLYAGTAVAQGVYRFDGCGFLIMDFYCGIMLDADDGYTYQLHVRDFGDFGPGDYVHVAGNAAPYNVLCPGDLIKATTFEACGPITATLVSAASRRTHGNAGVFDIDLALDDPPTVEPRLEGSTPQLVLTYDLPPDDPGCDGLEIVNGTCIATSGEGNDLVIYMNFDISACVCVTNGSDTVRLLVHPGNVNGDEWTNIMDMSAVKNVIYRPVTAHTFRYDVNVDGALNLIDLQETKNNLFQPAACP